MKARRSVYRAGDLIRNKRTGQVREVLSVLDEADVRGFPRVSTAYKSGPRSSKFHALISTQQWEPHVDPVVTPLLEGDVPLYAIRRELLDIRLVLVRIADALELAATAPTNGKGNGYADDYHGEMTGRAGG